MGDASEILIEFKGSAKEIVEALETIKDKASTLENQLKFTAAVSGIAFAALTAEIGVSVAAYGKQEVAANKLVQSLQNQGIYSKELVAKYREYAEAAEAKSGIDVDQITQGQAIIQGLIGQTQVSEQLTQAAVDLSTKTGSVTSAFELLGVSIEGRTKGLKKLGISIDEHLGKQERMAQIIDKVTQKVGGQAEAAVSGVAGIAKLEVAFEGLQKAIGEKFAPAAVAAEKYIAEFLTTTSKNKPLIELIAVLIGSAAAATGTVAALSGLGVALIAATHLAAAFGFTLAAALGPIGLAVAAFSILGGSVGYYAVKANEAGYETDELQKKMVNLRQGIDQLQKIADNPIKSVFSEQAKKDLQDAKDSLADIEERKRKLETQASDKVTASGQDDKKREAAIKAEQEEQARDARQRAALKGHNDFIHAETQNASKELIEIKKSEAELLDKIADEKYKSERGALQAQLAKVRDMEVQQRADDANKLNEFHEVVLSDNKAFGKLSEAEQQQFLTKNQAAVQSSLDTVHTARQKAALAEAQEHVRSNNQFLADQQKFGTAYALINQVMHSAVVEGSRKGFGELEQLSNSSNHTLMAIGKTAAIANITFKTAESAMNIFEGFSASVPPPFGEILGLAGAAAAIAYGGEQIASVNFVTAAQGGLITGGIPGMDSVPLLAMPGELVVPTRNYDEVVNAAAAKRVSDQAAAPQSQGFGSSVMEVILTAKGGFMDYIEAQLNERKRLGISQLGAFA